MTCTLLRTPSTGRGLLFIGFAAITWGVGGFAAAILYGTSGLGPVAVSFWRFLGGLVLLTAARRGRHPLRARVRRVLLTGLGSAIYQTAYYAAIPLAGLAVSTVVTLGTGPVLTAVGARLFLGERLGRPAALTVAASVVGLVILVQPFDGRASAAGVAVALLSAAGYTAVTLLSRAWRGHDDPLDSALGGFAVSAALVLPIALAQGILPHAAHLAGTIGWLAFLGAVPTALAYALFFTGLRTVRATTASVVALLEPVAAAVLAVAILHERLTLPAYLGGAVLLGSVMLLARQEGRTKEA